MEAFLELFGEYRVTGVTVATLALIISAIVFLYKLYVKIKEYLIASYEAKKAKDKIITDTYDEVKKYQEYRQRDREQSLRIQKELNDLIEKLESRQQEMSQQIADLSERSKNYELSNIRDRLLQNYRYYTSESKNPLKAWTELEKDAFFELFGEYESRGGNGYMHSSVKPEMNRLTVIPMSQSIDIAKLMQSRS